MVTKNTNLVIPLPGSCTIWSQQSSTAPAENVTSIQRNGFSYTTIDKSSNTMANWYTANRQRTARNRGVLPMNPFSYRKENYRNMEGRWTRIDQYGNLNHWDGVLDFNSESIQPLSPLSAEQIASIDARARTKIRLKIKDQKVNLVQAYAERKQTADLLAKTAQSIHGCISNLKKGNIVKAANALGVTVSKRKRKAYQASYADDQSKAVGGGWLALQYGWKPLLNDVYGSAELLAQASMREVFNRAASSVTENVESTTVVSINNGAFDRHSVVTVKYTIKYVVYFSSASETIHTLSQVGITNPLLIGWELLPWSFVIDWFIPMGNYLSSIDATLGLSFNKGSKTTHIEYNSMNTHTPRASRDIYGNRWVGRSTASQRVVRVNRELLPDFPATAFPSFKNPLSFDHAANAIALLNQLRK